jgi:uncharacterized protein (DUF1015 family)
MVVLEPFRAVRYAEAAGPLDNLVAPPYDAITGEERQRLFARSPYNVTHLTLPESAGEAARLYRDWLERRILVQEQEPSTWLLVDEFVTPDGGTRERRGVVGSLRADPYGIGDVLPHERTRDRVRDERVDLLRAMGVQPEPIFLLQERAVELPTPDRAPDLRADGAKLWRLSDVDTAGLVEGALLIADGHHRYESAVELRAHEPGARVMALVVSMTDPGLQVLPTHRVFAGRPDLAKRGEGESFERVDEALRALRADSYDHAAAVAYRRNGAELVRGRRGELDVDLVDRHGLQGIDYTPDLSAAVAAVDEGHADVAFLLRAPRVADVFAAARHGKRMPPKSTYFFPKPLSGLLFHPVRG